MLVFFILSSSLLLLFPPTTVDGILMGEESIYDRMQRLENLIGTLNSTLTQDLAGLRGTVNGIQTRLQTEIKEHCQSGHTQFHTIECSSTACTETLPVHFSPAFAGSPVLLYAVSYIDSEHNMNVRYALSHTGLTASSVNLKVETWADTKLYGIGVNWIACPP